MDDLLDGTGFNGLKRGRHGYFLYNRNDTVVGRSLDLYGEYCEAEAGYLAKLLAPGDIVVEVGANIGSHTVGLARAIGPTGTVIAIEPQPLLFQTLCANLALNSLTNVEPLCAAAGAAAGTIAMPPIDPTRADNFGNKSLGVAGGAGGQVAVVRLDDLLQPDRCKLIKVDVEGMEADVLRGAEALIRRCQPVLYVENDRVEKSAELITLVMELGYTPYWHMARLYNPDNFFGNGENVFPDVASANMLCAPGWLDIKGLDKMRVTGPSQTWRDIV